ncbi:protein ALP1-like [Tripterygium wilfordii]|uniref:protein ALP1-like n=1 Tax=Tripterygium wilfordii TaxID=458696 RepID=UPI0018F800C1|nr:protein ALP1-like [Tripterygium wilfordii]
MDNNSDSSDDMIDTFQLQFLAVASEYDMITSSRNNYSRRGSVPCRTGALKGYDWVVDILNGNPVRCQESFRMHVHVFKSLCRVLRDDYGLECSTQVGITEMVAMFVFTLGHAQSNRDIGERFQHSGETISRLFHKVLQAVMKMSKDLIKPRGDQLNETPRYIREHTNLGYRICFKDCIGALDGTHIPAIVTPEKRQKYIGRKGVPTQNVLAVCDFDMFYTYVSAGWEGSAHDSRVLEHSLRHEILNFPKPPLGKYYLVDAGYANKTGFLAPYKGERYHVPVFQNGAPASGPREVFNKAHAKLRNVIERTFGVTKKKWRILGSMTSFDTKIQAKIVIACMTLHNFIKLNAEIDYDFNEIESMPVVEDEIMPEVVVENVVEDDEDNLLIDDANMAQFRDLVAQQLIII